MHLGDVPRLLRIHAPHLAVGLRLSRSLHEARHAMGKSTVASRHRLHTHLRVDNLPTRAT